MGALLTNAGFDSSACVSPLLRAGLGYDVFIGVVHQPGAAGDRAPQIPGPEEKAMKEQFTVQRAENRVDMKVTALLIGRHGKLGVERAVTENVSSRGVRVISSSEWYVDDTILVSLPAGHYTSAARVAYCDASGKGRYVTGLEFVGTNEQLQITNIDIATEY